MWHLAGSHGATIATIVQITVLELQRLNTLGLLALVGASQGVVLALVLLFQPHGHRLANRILALFLGVHALRLSVYFLVYGKLLEQYPYAIVLLSLNIVLGPLLYLYIKALTTPEFSLKMVSPLHFLPFLLTFTGAVYLTIYAAHDPQLTIAWWSGDTSSSIEIQGVLFLLLSALYFLSYVLAAGRCLSAHKANIEALFSNTEGIQLRWLWFVISLCLLIAASTIVTQLLRLFSDLELGPRQPFALVITTLLIYYLAFMGMRQGRIFTPSFASPGLRRLDVPPQAGQAAAPALSLSQPLAGRDRQVENAQENVVERAVDPALKPGPGAEIRLEPKTDNAAAKYEKSGLKTEDLQRLWQKLESLMQEQKPYLDSDLKLADLAQYMGISQDYLSQVINRQGKTKFFDYINVYRVEEAKKHLVDSRHFNLLEIAFECGFSSQQAFSSRFKKVTNMTPSQFRRDHSCSLIE